MSHFGTEGMDCIGRRGPKCLKCLKSWSNKRNSAHFNSFFLFFVKYLLFAFKLSCGKHSFGDGSLKDFIQFGPEFCQRRKKFTFPTKGCQIVSIDHWSLHYYCFLQLHLRITCHLLGIEWCNGQIMPPAWTFLLGWENGWEIRIQVSEDEWEIYGRYPSFSFHDYGHVS